MGFSADGYITVTGLPCIDCELGRGDSFWNRGWPAFGRDGDRAPSSDCIFPRALETRDFRSSGRSDSSATAQRLTFGRGSFFGVASGCALLDAGLFHAADWRAVKNHFVLLRTIAYDAFADRVDRRWSERAFDEGLVDWLGLLFAHADVGLRLRRPSDTDASRPRPSASSFATGSREVESGRAGSSVSRSDGRRRQVIAVSARKLISCPSLLRWVIFWRFLTAFAG